MYIKRALIIAAHPDDDILGCGGLMSQLKQGVDFKVLFIAEGSTCRFPDSDTDEAQRELRKRTQMAKRALNSLSIDSYHSKTFPGKT